MICEVDSRGYRKAIREYKHKHRHDSKPREDYYGLCHLCGTETRMSSHHLIPKSIMFPARFIFSGQELKHIANGGEIPDYERTVRLCWPCHSELHRAVSNQNLAQYINTPEKLLEWRSKRWSFEFTKPKEPIRKFVINEKGRSYKLYY